MTFAVRSWCLVLAESGQRGLRACQRRVEHVHFEAANFGGADEVVFQNVFVPLKQINTQYSFYEFR
jgi:hypothetical protein